MTTRTLPSLKAVLKMHNVDESLPVGERTIERCYRIAGYYRGQERTLEQKRDECVRHGKFKGPHNGESWEFFNDLYDEANRRSGNFIHMAQNCQDLYRGSEAHKRFRTMDDEVTRTTGESFGLISKDPVYSFIDELESLKNPLSDNHGRQNKLLDNTDKRDKFYKRISKISYGLLRRRISQTKYESILNGTNWGINEILKEMRKETTKLNNYCREIYTGYGRNTDVGYVPLKIIIPSIDATIEPSNPVEERPTIIFPDAQQYKADMQRLAEGLEKRLGAV